MTCVQDEYSFDSYGGNLNARVDSIISQTQQPVVTVAQTDESETDLTTQSSLPPNSLSTSEHSGHRSADTTQSSAIEVHGNSIAPAGAESTRSASRYSQTRVNQSPSPVAKGRPDLFESAARVRRRRASRQGSE
jgi:hypothetical protein